MSRNDANDHEIESGFVDPEEVPEDAIVVNLDYNWMRPPEESKSLFELEEDEVEELLEEAEDKLRGVRIDNVASYLRENIPGYEEVRGMPAIIGEASIVVERTSENDYTDLYGDSRTRAMLSDAGYSLGQ